MGEGGAAYNLSQGPHLAETPLFTAALLPLTFLALGERREDLAALLMSPYYQALKTRQAALALWDRRFREKGAAQGWEHLRREAAREASGNPALEKIIGTLDQPVGPLRLYPGHRQSLGRVAGGGVAAPGIPRRTGSGGKKPV